jgi:hypothetical protein
VGYTATVETAWVSPCGAESLTGVGGKFAVDPTSLGAYDIYGGTNNVQVGTLSITAVPEPASMLFSVAGIPLIGAAFLRRKRRIFR